jgi:hypothetical protein
LNKVSAHSEAFLITGLPRSRTAWMAVAAMNDQSCCFHEPLRYLTRWEDVFDTVWRREYGYRYIGISDHGLGFHLQEIMRRMAPRTLIIERPLAEVNASLARLGLPPSNFCDILQERLAFQHPMIMRVNYLALTSSTVVMRCLRHLMPDAVLNHHHIPELQALNIQAHEIGKVLEHARRRGQAGDATALLGADVIARFRQCQDFEPS